MADSSWLLAGASGGIGAGVLARARQSDVTVTAIRRVARTDADADAGADAKAGGGVRWVRADLWQFDPGSLATPAAVISAGPLDAFAAFAGRARWPAGTPVAAVSSMSASTKVAGGHPAERAVAHRLLEAESGLQRLAGRHGWRLVVLRPTLVWGCRDRSITPLLRLARRWGRLPLARGATGRRQPVHADDVAAALVAAVSDPSCGPGPWPMPGGEVLAFDAMLERSLEVALPSARLMRLPDAPWRIAENLLSRWPGRIGVLASQARRARVDLDVREATGWPALGLRPRGFTPVAADFELGP